MSSIGSLLNIARNAMTSHQTAMLVTSNNVANAEVDGYSRQRAQLVTGPVTMESTGAMGSGVVVRDVSRVRDSLLDTTFRADSASASGYGLKEDLVGQVSDVFGPLASAGIDDAMDSFWSAWSDLANQPGSAPAKQLVRLSGDRLAAMLNDASARLSDVRGTTTDRLGSDVDQFNGLATQVGDLNREITLAEAGGQSAPALRDERDRVLDTLSGLATVQIVRRGDGSAAVLLDGSSIVDGDSVRALDASGGTPATLRIVGSVQQIGLAGGTIGAAMDVLNQVIPDTRDRLDGLARALADTTNELHEQGTAKLPDGTLSTGVDFFQVPAGGLGDVTAANLRLSDAVRADPSVIAAGYDVAGGTGDNTLALDLAGLRTTNVSVTVGVGAGAQTTQTKFSTFYADTVTTLGQLGRDAAQSATVYSTLASQADNRRLSVSGVSTDEELTQLMQQQQAYAAAARLVSVADEMARTIIDLGK